MELLEDRAVPATIAVTGTGDTIAVDGLVTLREATTSVNQGSNVNADVVAVGAYGTADAINFNIAGTGVQTINVTAALPTIARPVTINGYSQAGSSVNTLANADNAVLLVQLNGAGAGAAVDGLTLGAGSDGSTIRGLVVNRFTGDGIAARSNGNRIVGNFLGVDPTGTTRMPNGADGIAIENASNNLIGTPALADRNIASGNSLDGIHVIGTLTAPATGNVIQNNFVGVGADGKSSVGNRTEPAPAPGAAEGNNLFGIEISGGNNNLVGGTTAGARNVVGLNGAGIEVDNGGQGDVIQGKFFGVWADGVTPAGNLLHGIVLRSSNGFAAPLGPAQPNEPGVSFNQIGGTAAGAGNLVAFNGTGGIAVFGNPVSASGQPNIGNSVLGNSVFLNGRNFAAAATPSIPLLGLDLTNGFMFPRDDGLTPNDSKGHTAPNAPNSFQNFPMLTSVSGTSATGRLTAAPNSTYRIELFANNTDPLNQPAEGQQFLGFVSVTTDATGAATFTAPFNATVANGRIITATATDAIGNTSEFSAGLAVGAPAVSTTRLFAAGTGLGTPALVSVYNADGTLRFVLTPFAGYAGGVSVATGDVNGDGVSDVVVGAGLGAPGGHVKVFDGQTGVEIRSFLAFPGFTGGVVVSAGDIDGDGRADIIVGAARLASGHVKAFSGATGAEIRSFLAFPGYVGPIQVASGDVTGDGRADILVTAAVNGHVEAFSGADGSLVRSFFAFPGFVGDVFVASGDVNGDGRADIITGAGAGAPGGHVQAFSGTDGSLLRSFLSLPGFSGGARVAASDANRDGKADFIVGTGPGAANVTRLDAVTLGVLDAFNPFPGFNGGVFVG